LKEEMNSNTMSLISKFEKRAITKKCPLYGHFFYGNFLYENDLVWNRSKLLRGIIKDINNKMEVGRIKIKFAY
jgi:hypothetical protein